MVCEGLDGRKWVRLWATATSEEKEKNEEGTDETRDGNDDDEGCGEFEGGHVLVQKEVAMGEEKEGAGG